MRCRRGRRIDTGLRIRLQLSSNCKKNLRKRRSSMFILTEGIMSKITKVLNCWKLRGKRRLEELIRKVLLLRLRTHLMDMRLWVRLKLKTCDPRTILLQIECSALLCQITLLLNTPCHQCKWLTMVTQNLWLMHTKRRSKYVIDRSDKCFS